METKKCDATRLDLPVSRLRGRRKQEQLAIVVNDVCTKSQCNAMIATAEKQGFDLAKLDPFAVTTQTKVRKSSRCVLDDMVFAAQLWEQLERIVPPDHVAGWRPLGVHESMRILKYYPGDYFKPHYDQPMTRPAANGEPEQRSFLSIVVYLNTPEVGGQTRFFHEKQTVTVDPQEGSCLIFDQSTLRHEGCMLVKGVKYAIRTDMMYVERVAAVRTPAVDTANAAEAQRREKRAIKRRRYCSKP